MIRVSEEFPFHGGRLSVNFTATVGMRWRDGGFDRLPDAGSLAAWFAAAGLPLDTTERVSTSDLRHARELREAIYRLLREGKPAQSDVDIVNRWATLPAAPRRLHVTRQGLVTELVAAPPRALLACVAQDAVELLGGPDSARVRECANPQCSLLFIDTSRAAARRWCSMATCGSRDKMSRYRAGRDI